MSEADFWFPHSVLIRPMLPGGGRGPRLSTDEPATVPAEVDDEHKLVRDATGTQVVSSARVTVPLDTAVPLGSEVTLWPGRNVARAAAVIAVSREENGDGLDSQLVLTLT